MSVNWNQLSHHEEEYGHAWEGIYGYFSYAIRPNLERDKMRVTFNLEVKAEIDSFDAEKRQVFIEVMTRAARELYTKATLLSGNVSPKIDATVEDREHGVQQVDLFKENGRKK
jgi:hypothetical protein